MRTVRRFGHCAALIPVLFLATLLARQAAAALAVKEGPHPVPPHPVLATADPVFDGKSAPREAVEAEVAWLEARLLRLKGLQGTIYLPPYRPGSLGGLAVRQGNEMWAAVYSPGGVHETSAGVVVEDVRSTVVLAAYPHPAGAVEIAGEVCAPWPEAAARYVTAHEIGHLARWAFVPDWALQEYAAWRSAGRAQDPEEIFAEDFRALFGSPAANILRPSDAPVPPLAGSERLRALEWFLKWLGPPAR